VLPFTFSRSLQYYLPLTITATPFSYRPIFQFLAEVCSIIYPLHSLQPLLLQAHLSLLPTTFSRDLQYYLNLHSMLPSSLSWGLQFYLPFSCRPICHCYLSLLTEVCSISPLHNLCTAIFCNIFSCRPIFHCYHPLLAEVCSYPPLTILATIFLAEQSFTVITVKIKVG
jgi:hypothetical protein